MSMAQSQAIGVRSEPDVEMTGLQRRAAVLVALGEFIDGYDLLVMGTALIYLQPQLGLSPSATGLLGASTFLGAMIGLIVFGDMSDRLGRRSIFVINLVFFVAFSILSAFITNVTQLFVARFLIGVGVGMDIPTSTAYLAEITPRHRRGAILGALTQITWILGALTSTLIALPLGWAFGAQAWRWMFALVALPALLVLLGRRLLPESPRWLLNRGRTAEAEAAFRAFGMPVPARGVMAARQTGSYAELFRPPHARRLFWVSALFFLNCLTGSISSIATPFVLRYVGHLSLTQTVLFSALIWLTGLLGALTSYRLIDRIGRRKLAYLSLIPSGFFAIGMGVFSSQPAMLIGCFMLFSYFGWLGGAGLPWAWASELFPTHLRGRSQGVCNAVCRIAISITIFLVPVAQATVGFETLILALSLGRFLFAFIVSRQPMLATENIAIDALSDDGTAAVPGG